MKDSFREALASRVLWILLGFITLFLLALAPLSVATHEPEEADGAAAGAEAESSLTYWGYPVGPPLPMDQQAVTGQVRATLAVVVNFLLGNLGVFIAVLVTASMVPNMLEPGSIDLLLSKPVSRPLLLLSKFVGGCAFILLNAAYFIAGIWLFVGWRFGIWDGKLLLAIPVFLFLFGIYYAVSAWAGVIWQNAVVSVVVTILFWAACFTVGTTKNVLEAMLDPQRVAVILPMDDDLLAANRQGEVLQWQEDAERWSRILASDAGGPAAFGFAYPWIGPVYDAQNERLVAIERPWMPGLPGTLVFADRAEDWQRADGPSTPPGIQSLFVDSQGQIILVGTEGIYHFHEDDLVPIGPPRPVAWSAPLTAAMNPQDDGLAIVHRGRLTVLQKESQKAVQPVQTEENRYRVTNELDLKTDQPAVLAYAGHTLLIALASGQVQLIHSADRLELQQSFQPFDDIRPRAARADPQGRWFAVLYHHGQLWLYDAQNQRPVDARLRGQGDITAAAFSGDSRLYAADRFGRVTRYQSGRWTVQRQYSPESGMLERIYRYGVLPFYTIFPKPGEMDQMVSHLLTDEQLQRPHGVGNHRQAEPLQRNIWQPIWSNLAFLAVVLALACLSMSRRDF